MEEEVGLFLDPEQLIFVEKIVSNEDYKEDHIHIFSYRFRHKPKVLIDNKEVESYCWADKHKVAQLPVFSPLIPVIHTRLKD